MSKETGGPAYPLPLGSVTVEGQEGMTLRDYFATKAMAAYISTAGGPCIIGGLDGAEDHLADQSYAMADAMLEARK
ncbi:hypothetical protein AAGQ96_12995 [Pantoea sp. MBD-2R]|uniref:hypothetical protein n=1 Tax=Pantoea sp. MBD-2R TaxID=3141540 RepID=UPI003183FD63